MHLDSSMPLLATNRTSGGISLMLLKDRNPKAIPKHTIYRNTQKAGRFLSETPRFLRPAPLACFTQSTLCAGDTDRNYLTTTLLTVAAVPLVRRTK